MKKTVCGRIVTWIQKGIRRMLDFYKRCWHIFLPLFGVFVIGIISAIYYLNGKSYQWDVIIAVLILAIICLIVGLIGFIRAFRYARKEEREAKVAKTYESLKESFKTLYIKEGKSPEEAQKLAEIAATNIPLAPPVEGEEEWVSPREAYKKSCRKGK
jgi:predicted histidine transporter YuiF (NhaC family)